MTRKERLRHYRKMLVKYKESKIRQPLSSRGLCSVSLACGILAPDENKFNGGNPMRDTFPELYSQKPAITFNSCYWWDPKEIAPRMKALQEAIKLCQEPTSLWKLTIITNRVVRFLKSI